MTKERNTRRGFTLIELLVVVLIISILAAVAVPLYNKAMLKSRLAEYESNLHTLAQAASACELAKGEACTIEELDVQIPSCRPIPSLFDSCSYGIADNVRVALYISKGTMTNIGFCYYWKNNKVTDGRIPDAPITKTNNGLYCAVNTFTPSDCAKFGFTEFVIYNLYKRP